MIEGGSGCSPGLFAGLHHRCPSKPWGRIHGLTLENPFKKSLEKEQVCSLRGGNRNSGATLMLGQPPADSCETEPCLHKRGPSQCSWSLCGPVRPAGPLCLPGGAGSVKTLSLASGGICVVDGDN